MTMFDSFKEKPPGKKLLVLAILVFFSIVLFNIISVILINPLFGINILSNPEFIENYSDPNSIAALKFMQLINSFGLFIVPSVIFVLISTSNPYKFLNIQNKNIPILYYLIIPLLMISAMPLINLLAELNLGIKLPEELGGIENWMKSKEEDAEKITIAFLSVNTIGGLLYNILIIAIIPAVGEELMFRGVLQKLFSKLFQNYHSAIWITAILFSALHMQFYGFLPRMMMGVLFGYLIVWTGSLWIPTLAHFINNGVAVLSSFLIDNNIVKHDLDKVGTEQADSLYIISSLIVVTLILIFFYSNKVLTLKKDDINNLPT